MELPKFLLGDNTDFPTAIFIIHTDYPRFIINLEDDQVEWLEDFSSEDEKELSSEAENLIQAANDFYDREINLYNESLSMDKLITLDQELFLFLNGLGNSSWDGFWMFMTDKLSSIPLYVVLLILCFMQLK